MNKGNKSKIPEFKSFEEEKEYWEVRGPLAEGHRGRINKPKVGEKRSSFLVVRLTGDELTNLRDIAARQKLGTSTFARLVLTSVIEHRNKMPKSITWEQLWNILENSLPQTMKEKAENLFKNTVIGEPNNPSMLIIDGTNLKDAEEFTLSLLKSILAIAGVQVITKEHQSYEKVKALVKE